MLLERLNWITQVKALAKMWNLLSDHQKNLLHLSFKLNKMWELELNNVVINTEYLQLQ